jgi:hypothetical protein
MSEQQSEPRDVAHDGRVLEVYDRLHKPHLVMILRLDEGVLDIEPSAEARAHIEQDLIQGREEARHLPVLGWLIEKAILFTEERMADYFGPHDLSKLQIRFDGQTMHLRIGRTQIDLGPGEIDPHAAAAFVREYEYLKGR